MGELRLRVASSYGSSDLAARFDDHTTIGQLADAIEEHFDRAGHTPRSVHRRSRGALSFDRSERVAGADLRNGDEVELALDTGVRANELQSAIATLRVVDGPEVGRVYELHRGESTVGRSKSCTVTINDDMASRTHASIRVTDIVEVADAGSTNGVVVNGELISGVRRLRPGDKVLIGDTSIVVDLLGGSHEAVDLADNSVEFNRPPRIDRPFAPTKIALPSPLDPPPKQRLPLIAAAVPLLMGLVILAAGAGWQSVIFIAMSPLMMFGSFWESKRSGKADYADRKSEHEATMSDQIDRLDELRQEEILSRFRFFPSNDELLGVVADLSERLWEREPEDADFLELRVGLREQASQVQVEVDSGGKRDQRLEMAEIVAAYATLPPVPVTFNARREAPVAIAGPAGVGSGIARALVLQSATLHSPSELSICAVVSEENRSHWQWLKWLPHANGLQSGISVHPLAVGADEGVEVLTALAQLLDERLEAHSGSTIQPIFTPHQLLLIDSSAQIERSRFRRLLEDGAANGISVLWLAGDARRVPNACRTIIDCEPGGTSVTLGQAASGAKLGGIPAETVSVESAEIVARAMSPIVDISADSGGAVSLPSTVGLVDLLGGLEVLDDTAVVKERWYQSAKSRKLRAPVGIYEGGSLSLDIRVDGPHGLIGGTTGAGKSEFLQALLAGIAASHSPERVNFLLVDYKGGSAFGDLVDQFDEATGQLTWRGLQHTVGMITDLTPTLVQRSLVSLQAELQRREHILNAHRMKDLMEMEKHSLAETPPTLLIVVDEFAALAKEVPAFVDGVVDIAQRGRSLGMHLLLATQKPGGVVTPNIQANTELRVALRVASEDESMDIIRSPIAGRLDRGTPGRGAIRRGPSDLVVFQSAYVGGVTTPDASATLELGEFDLSGVSWFTSSSQGEPSSAAVRESDLRRLVRIVNKAAVENGTPNPRKPWLDPLPSNVDLLKLPRPENDLSIPFGLADDPRGQTRSVASFSPELDGSLLLYGMGASGKTVALRSIICALGLTKSRAPSHVYVLDFAGRNLDMLSSLPHVGSVVSGDDYERVTRVLMDLRSEIDRRAIYFAGASSLDEYRAQGHPHVPRIVLALDSFDNFLATYERIDRGDWADMFPRLVADGRQVGVHFLLTGSRRSSFPQALAAQVSSRLIFKMASEDDYHSVNADPSHFEGDLEPGRCRWSGTEVQVAILGGATTTAAEALEIHRLGAALTGRTSEAPAVRILPEAINLSDLPETSNGFGWLLTSEFSAVGPDLSQHVLIAGPPRSGKTTALKSLISASRLNDPEVYGASSQGDLNYKSFSDLAARLESDQSGLIFIDDAERLTGSPAEFSLSDAVAAGELIVVLAADSNAARGYSPLFQTARTRGDVLVLHASPDMDTDLVGVPIPRTQGQPPPGRGFARTAGLSAVVQVALAN